MAKSIKAAAKVFSAIGLDLADDKSDWVGLDEAGAIIGRERVRTTESELRTVFGAVAPTKIAIEVGTHSAWISRVLSGLGHEVVVANARRVALIHGNKRKNNRIDAELLARLARADTQLLFPVVHRGAESQADLAVLRSRDMLVRSRSRFISHVRGVSKTFGVRLPKCSAEAFVLRCSALIPFTVLPAINVALEQISSLTVSIKTLDNTIAAMMDKYPAAHVVAQIKGVGELTALAFVLTIDDPHRIRCSRSAGAYFGLVPGTDDSGETHAQKRITKEGDPFCRRLLVGAAQYILGPFGLDCDLRRHGQAIAERGGKRAKKRAVIAVARKLAVLMHRLWIRQDIYVPLFNAGKTATAA